MADITAGLIAYLKTISAVTDIVGTGADAKIYEETAPARRSGDQIAAPYILIRWNGGISHAGLSQLAGLADADLQVDAYSTTAPLALTLAEAIRLAPLDMIGLTTMGSVTVQSVRAETSYRRGFDKPTKGGHNKRYWVSRDYTIYYVEATNN